MDFIGPQGVLELSRVHEIVLDGIGGPHDLSFLESFDGFYHLELSLEWKSGTQACRVYDLRVRSFALEKYRMLRQLWKFLNFRLDGRTIPGANSVALLPPFILRQKLPISPHHLMRQLIRPRDMRRLELIGVLSSIKLVSIPKPQVFV